jgi:hypothetical protein
VYCTYASTSVNECCEERLATCGNDSLGSMLSAVDDRTVPWSGMAWRYCILHERVKGKGAACEQRARYFALTVLLVIG